MKKIILSLLVLSMFILLTACSDKDSTISSNEQPDIIEQEGETEDSLTTNGDKADEDGTLESKEVNSTENTLQEEPDDIEEPDEVEVIDEIKETKETGEKEESYC